MAAIKSFENAIAALNDPVPATATVEPVAVDTSATVATVTDGVECTNCHAKLGTSAKFCPKCGTKIETKKPSFCVECGASLAAGTNFCPECGTKV